jgi:phosphatidylinositol kinase/protein kinase (PI-3  family)
MHNIILDIRTYSVVPLNEECGLIEWVRNTVAMRVLLKQRYDTVGISMMVCILPVNHRFQLTLRSQACEIQRVL